MRVLFGCGRMAELASEADGLGLHRLLVLSTPGQVELAHRVADVLGSRTVGMYSQARMHVPVDTVIAATDCAKSLGADGCVAVGGGSTIGLAKALARKADLPAIAIPTTYSGSEMTTIWGITEDGRKQTGRNSAVLPRSVIYDPELTVGLPVSVSGASGINAIAHAVEALYAPDSSPLTNVFAEQGVRCLASALPAIAADPTDRAARSQALQGAWLCGACLGATTMSLHHKICHVLGGTFDLPHAPTHAVMLSHVAAFNLPAAPAAHEALCRALQCDDPVGALTELADATGVARSLDALGAAGMDFGPIIEQVLATPYANPRPVTRDDLEALLTGARNGTQSPTRPTMSNAKR
ncbi:maleylacetate reductase [Mycobacterium sp. AT1]|uniref:maleylacetate reductase n=1 Tax=Mycobacterium sp. AT1 TaxID=1961706 RepID=UPI003519B0AA